MTTSEATEKKPLWLLIEENLLELGSQDVSESSIQQLAEKLDNEGYNVSGRGGNLLQLRWAVDDMRKVGRPLLKDLKDAVSKFNLDDVTDPYATTDNLIREIGETWPNLKKSERRVEVIRLVEKTKLDLLTAKAKSMPDDQGIRLMIAEKIADNVIIKSLDITDEKLKQVKEDIKKERAERARVEKLLEAVASKSDEEKVKHLFENNVSEKLVLEIAKVDQSAIDGAKKAMEEELKEKERLAEEAAAKKKAEAEGPSLDAIPPDQMLEYIESIREIMEFSDQEKEIRVMCEQSAIPKSLVDIAVSDPEKLDELEKQAQG